jgi:hypothetical protein
MTTIEMGLLLFFTTVLGQVPAARTPGDAISRLRAEYLVEAERVRGESADEKNRFMEEWAERLRSAIQDHPSSPNAPWARGELRGTLNSLGRLKELLALLSTNVTEAETVWDRAYLLQQMGLIAEMSFYVDRDVTVARQAIDSFREVRDLIKEPDVWWVVGLQKTAGLTASAFGDPLGAARLHMEVVDVFHRLSPSQQADLSHYAFAEESLSDAAVQFAKAGDVVSSMNASDQLQALTELRRPVPEHSRRLLSPLSGIVDARPYCERSQKWLSEHLDAPSAEGLAYDLGFAWIRVDDHDRAAWAFEQFLTRAETARPNEILDRQIGSVEPILRRRFELAGETNRLDALQKQVAGLRPRK